MGPSFFQRGTNGVPAHANTTAATTNLRCCVDGVPFSDGRGHCLARTGCASLAAACRSQLVAMKMLQNGAKTGPKWALKCRYFARCAYNSFLAVTEHGVLVTATPHNNG